MLGRNEPSNLRQLVEMIAGIKGLPVREVGERVYQNSLDFFGLDARGRRVEEGATDRMEEQKGEGMSINNRD